MFNIPDLYKLNGYILYFWVAVSVSTLLAGVLFILAFNYELFRSLELVKLLLLAISITLPVFLLNCFLFGAYSYNLKKEKVEGYFDSVMFAATPFTGFFFYLLIVLRLFNRYFDIKSAIIVLGGLEGVYLLALLTERKKQEKKRLSDV